MATYSYTTASLDRKTLIAEIRAALPDKVTGIYLVGTDLEVTTEEDLDAADETTLDGVIAAHTPPTESLDQAKARCIEDVRNWRNYKIEYVHKVEYPASSGKLFSIGFVDQINWSALWNIRSDQAKMDYPYRITTWDELDYHDFANSNEVDAIYDLVVSTVKGEITAARDAILLVVAATTIEDAEAACAAYTAT
jgi:hypothetical protein